MAAATHCSYQENDKLEETPEAQCLPNCECMTHCPPDCSCKTKQKHFSLIFNAIGIVFAVIAMYMIISTDSKMYLVFWVAYSILRRMMLKPKKVKFA